MDNFRLYDHFGYMKNVRPSENCLLGKEIVWTVKEDGSNTGIYWDDESKRYRICSRNARYAVFEPKMLQLPEVAKVMEFLSWVHVAYGSQYIVYGEFMQKGWSPTHLKNYEEDSYKVFDIYDCVNENYLPFGSVCNLLKPFEIPVVDVVAITKSNNIDELKKTQIEVLNLLDSSNRSIIMRIKRFFKKVVAGKEEGVVGKCIDGKYHYYFKAKYGLHPKFKSKSNTSPILKLPQIEESEIRKCIHKVKDKLSEEDFKNPKIAMPLIAEEVGLECKQTACSNKIKLFPIYQDVLNE